MKETLTDVRKLARSLDLDGVEWFHVDRRDIRLGTAREWSEHEKIAWKTRARQVYPWRRITVLPPQFFTSHADMVSAGRDLAQSETP